MRICCTEPLAFSLTVRSTPRMVWCPIRQMLLLAIAIHGGKKKAGGHTPEERGEVRLPPHGGPGYDADLQHTGEFSKCALQAGGGDVRTDGSPAATRPRREAHNIAGEADHRVAPDGCSGFRPEHAGAVGQDRPR